MNLRSFFHRVRNLFHKESLNRELNDELASHLQLHIDDNLCRGMSPDEARRVALLKLGGLEQTKLLVRDQQILSWLDSLRRDAMFGFRQLAKNKITTAAAILSLALAIGACTSAFRLIDALLLRPLPVANANHLYFLSSDPKAWWSASGASFIVRTSSPNPLALATSFRRAIPRSAPTSASATSTPRTN